MTIMVLFGGVSTEYLVSLRSAYHIIGGLREAGHVVIPVGITTEGQWLRYSGPDEAIIHDTWQELALTESAAHDQAAFAVRSPRDFILSLCQTAPDCIFPAVHGINCEDGTLQGLLTLSGFPYVGCGVLASAACMDKRHARLVFSAVGLPQCPYLAVTRSEIEKNPELVCERIQKEIGFPCFLKPSNGGSSVGTRRVHDQSELMPALQEVCRFDQTLLIETFLYAREIEVSVIGVTEPLIGAIGEVATSGSFDYYDYEAKYFSDEGAKIIVPARLDEETARLIKQYAIKAYQAMSCTGMARVDFFLEKSTGNLYLNEINTIPGFTPISIFPKAFDAIGLPLPQLVTQLCQMAVEAHQNAKRQETI